MSKGWSFNWENMATREREGVETRCVERHPRLTRARAAQGGVTLGLEQGELGADFGYRRWCGNFSIPPAHS